MYVLADWLPTDRTELAATEDILVADGNLVGFFSFAQTHAHTGIWSGIHTLSRAATNYYFRLIKHLLDYSINP